MVSITRINCEVMKILLVMLAQTLTFTQPIVEQQFLLCHFSLLRFHTALIRKKIEGQYS